jgi:hypothetical protein
MTHIRKILWHLAVSCEVSVGSWEVAVAINVSGHTILHKCD